MTAPDRAVTVGAGGAVAVWELPAVRPVALDEGPGFRSPVLTPGGTYLIGRTDTGVRFIHTRTGAVAGERPYPARPATAPVLGGGPELPGLWLAVRPDGAELAGLSEHGTALARWGLAADGPAERTPLDRSAWYSTLESLPTAYADPDHLLVLGRTLYDLRRGEKVWCYHLDVTNGRPSGVWASQTPDARVWFATPGPWAVAAAELPGNRERAVLRAATAPGTRLGPGTKVRVTVRFDGDQTLRDAVREAVHAAAAGRGWEVLGDGAEVGLVVVGRPGPAAPGFSPVLMVSTIMTAGGQVIWRSAPAALASPARPGADPDGAARVTAGFVGNYLTTQGGLPAHVGKTADGYVTVPGSSILTVDGQTPLVSGTP